MARPSGLRVCAPLNETVLEEAARLVNGDRGTDYGPPIDNHGCTADLFTAYLHRKYGAANVPMGIDAVDVCWFNILQKCSRDAHTPGRDNLVDVAGYAENIQRVRDARS